MSTDQQNAPVQCIYRGGCMQKDGCTDYCRAGAPPAAPSSNLESVMQEYHRWWNSITREGDPSRRPNLSIDSFKAGWQAHSMAPDGGWPEERGAHETGDEQVRRDRDANLAAWERVLGERSEGEAIAWIAGMRSTLTNVAQIMDAWKQTAPQEWTVWDQEQRDAITAHLTHVETKAPQPIDRAVACLEPAERYGVRVINGRTEEFWAALFDAFSEKSEAKSE